MNLSCVFSVQQENNLFFSAQQVTDVIYVMYSIFNSYFYRSSKSNLFTWIFCKRKTHSCFIRDANIQYLPYILYTPRGRERRKENETNIDLNISIHDVKWIWEFHYSNLVDSIVFSQSPSPPFKLLIFVIIDRDSVYILALLRSCTMHMWRKSIHSARLTPFFALCILYHILLPPSASFSIEFIQLQLQDNNNSECQLNWLQYTAHAYPEQY